METMSLHSFKNKFAKTQKLIASTWHITWDKDPTLLIVCDLTTTLVTDHNFNYT